jgi:hypothetical protein
MSTFLHKLLGASSRCRVVKLSWADWLAAAVGRPGSSHGTLLIKNQGREESLPLVLILVGIELLTWYQS